VGNKRKRNHKRENHRAYWDLAAARLALLDINLYNEVRKQAHGSNAHLGDNTFVSGCFRDALDKLGELHCGPREVKYLARAMRRNTTPPASPFEDLSRLVHTLDSVVEWKTVDFGKIEARATKYWLNPSDRWNK
jgi:hypothetical protein